MKKPIYLLVADRSKARIFNTDARMDVLDLVFETTDSSGRKIRSEIESDRPGRTNDSMGHIHGLGDDHSAEQHESRQFAKYLGEVLGREHQQKKFRELMIAASPHFLGDLRHNIDAECRKALSVTIDKDLLHVSGADIAAHFKSARAAAREAKASH
jgi:protein required for attachment to host cells